MGRNESGAAVSLPTQVADVKKVLGPAREIVEAGNRIVLDQDDQGRSCSYLEHKRTGKKTVIHERNGAFQFDINVPNDTQVEPAKTTVEEVNEPETFQGPGTLMPDLFH